MTELKTLKDFEEEYKKYNFEDSVVPADVLKEEAIKWIRELEKCQREDGSCNHDNDDHYYFGERSKGDSFSQQECVAVKDWIKHFFDITKGDMNG